MELVVKNMKIEVDLNLTEVIGHVVIWGIIGVITLGIGFMVYPYSALKLLLNKTYLIDRTSSRKIGKFKCNVNLASQIGHAIVWFFITLITFGLGGLLYLYYVVKFVLNEVEIEQL